MSRIIERLRSWIHDWQEALFQLPTLVLLIVAAAFIVPALSRQAGVPVAAEWLPELGFVLVVTFKLAMAGFSAWLLQRLYQHSLSPAEEERLQRELEGWPGGSSRGALIRLAADRLGWFACFAVCCWAYF